MRHPKAPRIALARAPLRVSLAGGGTDLPSFADRFGGLVISAAINRYISVTVFPRSFDRGVRMTGEETEHCSDVAGMRNRFAGAALRRAGVRDDVQIASCADAPSGTGLGGSGAFTVALLHALRLVQRPDAVRLAEEASAIEMIDLARPVGKHDHYMAACGGLRALHVAPDRAVRAEPLAAPPAVVDYLRDRLLLFHTGLSRDAGQVLAVQDQLTRHGNERTIAALRTIRQIAEWMVAAVRRNQVDDIGPLMHEHWQSKTRLSDGVSNDHIDALYKVARAAGSDGGKLLGAGGGGFLLISAGAGRADEVRAAMAAERVRELPFALDRTGCVATGLPL
jgi:D-glycero-alpha-D-manno-heptose-7-phosphate kinase